MTNEELLAVLKKNPLPVGCVIACLALGAGIYFRGGQIPDLESEVQTRTAEADRHEANKKNAAQLKEQLEAVTNANKEISSRLVRSSELGVNYQYFYQTFGEAGVKQLELRQAPAASPKPGTPKAAGFVPVAFTVSVQGDLTAVLKFLRLVESGARYARVMNAVCSVTATDRKGPVTLTLNLELLGQP